LIWNRERRDVAESLTETMTTTSARDATGPQHSATIIVNGTVHDVAVDPNTTLLEFLREGLGLSGAREGCDTGGCGACTVLVDGRPMYSCLVLAMDCRGKEVLTIEGLSADGELHPIQRAFVDHGAIQCGFCTPGMVLTAKALLDENPAPTEQQVREAIAGNICRCTGYVKIVEAILAAAEEMRAAPR
jgi:aerobic carbon-monoxide dehydrogenase small subunit